MAKARVGVIGLLFVRPEEPAVRRCRSQRRRFTLPPSPAPCAPLHPLHISSHPAHLFSQDDTHYAAHFDGKQRTMEMQVQGRFKQLPRGVLFLGGEITERLTLGLVAKSLANVLLKVKP